MAAEPVVAPTSDSTAVTRGGSTASNRSRWQRIVSRWGAASIAFTILATVFGGIFAVVTPPFWGHDELTQFSRAYQVSQGEFLPTEIEDDRGVSYGGTVPESVEKLMNLAYTDYTTNPPEPAPMVEDPARYDDLSSAPVSGRDVTVWFTNTAAYSPVPYLPASAGIKIAEALDLDVGGFNLATRIAGLVAYVVLIAFGLSALRRYRSQWLAFTIALLPIAVFQAGTITADTMTNGVALLVSALLAKALFIGDRLTKPETAALLAAAVVLPLCKPTYVLLAMLVVVIPTVRLFVRPIWRWLPTVFAAIGLGLFLVWTKISSPTTEGMGLMRKPEYWNSVVPADQLHGVIEDPLHFANIAFESVMRRDQEWFTEFFGELGFAYVNVPALSIVAALVALILSLGIAERFTSSQRRTALVAAALVASVAMIYGTLYLSFTPVGYFIIDGVQGRYFVPLAIAGFAVLLRWVPLRYIGVREQPGRGVVITIIVASVVSLSAAVLKYWSIVYG